MFKLFSETIDGMPAPAVRHFINRIHATFEDALLYKRIDETREVHSILCFCQFMNTIFEDDVIFPVDGLPVQHVALYGKIVIHLIEAGELPPAARAKFEATFSTGFMRSLATCQTLSDDFWAAMQPPVSDTRIILSSALVSAR
jgi:hypothetical protein